MRYAILIMILLSSTLHAEEPTPVMLQFGDAAPFNGWLLSPERAANLVVKIKALRLTVEAEKERAHDISAVYEDALDELATNAIADVLDASRRTWWERLGQGAVGCVLGVLVGTMSTYMIMSLVYVE